MSKRKSKYSYKVLKNGEYAIQRSGRTIARVDSKRSATCYLEGRTGLSVLPDSWERCGYFYA